MVKLWKQNVQHVACIAYNEFSHHPKTADGYVTFA